jgi:hypothetical protein
MTFTRRDFLALPIALNAAAAPNIAALSTNSAPGSAHRPTAEEA